MPNSAAELRLEREFERLYRRHRRDVYRCVLRDVRNPDEAEDVTQTAFLDAYRALQRGDEPERPRAWLLTIAQNAARRRYRARTTGPREVELEAELLVAPGEAGPSAVEIRHALACLGARQREALVLREIAGRSYVEIAAALDLSVPAVETLLFRARRALRRELTGWEPPCRTRRRTAGPLVWPLPVSLGDALGSLFGRTAKHGATAKVAGAVSVAVLGAGVALQPGPASQTGRFAGRTALPDASAPLAASHPARPARERAGASARGDGPAKKARTPARPAAPRGSAGSEAPLVEVRTPAVGSVAVPSVRLEVPTVTHVVAAVPAVLDAVDGETPEIPVPLPRIVETLP